MGWLTSHFQIISAVDTAPPEITNMSLIHSDPKDTSPLGVPEDFSGGWEKFTCTVTDDVYVNEVKLISIGDTTTEYPMIKDGDEYSCNITIPTAGVYNYHIWANDLISNVVESAPQIFELPLNEDVDESGKVHFMDLIAVSLMYNDEGPLGWVREDVDNGGKVHFMDLIAISLLYNVEWK
jgi:hypothetical protein